MLVFIVVVAVVLVGLVAGIAAVTRSAPEPRQMHQGLQLAQGRMELILEQRNNRGFAAFDGTNFDPCVTAGAQEACQVPPTYTVVAPCYYTGATTCPFGSASTCKGGDVNYKCMRVRVTGPDGTVLAELDGMVANY